MSKPPTNWSQLSHNQSTPELQKAFAVAWEHHDAGRLAEAEALYRQVLLADPNYAEALHMLGVIAQQCDRFPSAIDLIKQAIALYPRQAIYHLNLGEAYRKSRRFPEAREAYLQALAINPHYAIAYYNLGIVYKELAFADGHESQRQTIIDLSYEAYDKAIACDPDFADAYWNRALCDLLVGNFTRGWEDYEWRWQRKSFTSPRRDFSRPIWCGETISESIILLHSEQGYGDAIQFARYIPLVEKRAEKVIVECPREVFRLIQSASPSATFIENGQPLPPFDLHAPFLSLPRALNTQFDSIPATVPYLRADPAAVESWRKRFTGPAFTVGVVWAGNPHRREDHFRSMDLDAMASLLAVPDVAFVSLQKGSPAAQLAQAVLPIQDISADLHDFMDTAAAITALDLVISVDTAVAHLAGALAKPVWTLLQKAADWRYFLDVPTSPWYPTMRLIRQSREGDWNDVIARAAMLLTQYARARKPLTK